MLFMWLKVLIVKKLQIEINFLKYYSILLSEPFSALSFLPTSLFSPKSFDNLFPENAMLKNAPNHISLV